MRIALKRRSVAPADSKPRQSVEVSPVALAGVMPAQPGLHHVWHETVQTYCAQPACMLFFSLIGFASAFMLGAAVSTLAGGELQDVYPHATGPLPTYRALGKIEYYPANNLFMLLLFQGITGWMLSAFSCGVLTHAVLFRRGVWAACHAAVARLPALLVVTLLSSVLMGFGAVGVNIGLRNAALDLSNAGQNAITPHGMLEKAAMHAIDQSLPAAGAPVIVFVPFLRNRAFTEWDVVPDYNATMAVTYGIPSELPAQSSNHEAEYGRVRYVMITSALAVLLVQVLLCFGMPAVFKTQGSIAPLLQSAGWGMRYIVPIMVHKAGLYLVLAGIKIGFIILPLVLMQGVVNPQQWMDDTVKVYIVPVIVITLGLINAVFSGFVLVYETTLFLKLKRA